MFLCLSQANEDHASVILKISTTGYVWEVVMVNFASPVFPAVLM